MAKDLVNDTFDLCRVCSMTGGDCFTLKPGEIMQEIELRADKLAFQCASDEAAKDGVEHDVREFHQGVIEIASNISPDPASSEADDDTLLYVSSFTSNAESGKNLFIHVRDEFHQGYPHGTPDEFDNQADYEGKSRADALLKVVHARTEGG